MKTIFASLALLFAALLVSACATTTVAYPRDAYPDPSYEFSQFQRGALIDAIPEEPIRADDIRKNADLLTPQNLVSFFDPQLVTQSGFQAAYKAKRSSMSDVLPVRLHFWSIDAQGRAIRASGMLYLPLATTPVSLVSYAHGTELERAKAPSVKDSSDYFMALYASSGFAMACDDYPGLGDSDGYHPYCHNVSLAHSGTDMLRASRAFLKLHQNQWTETGRTYVAGYSEGGYAAMAVARELVDQAQGEFNVRAIYPLAGPFSLSGVMANILVSSKPYEYPAFFPLLVLGYAQAEGIDPREVLSAEAYRFVLPLVDGRKGLTDIDDSIWAHFKRSKESLDPRELLSPSFVKQLEDPIARAATPLFAALRKNDLLDWNPRYAVDIHLMAAPADTTVPFANSKAAFDALSGSPNARTDMVELKATNHVGGFFESYFLVLKSLWDYEKTAK